MREGRNVSENENKIRGLKFNPRPLPFSHLFFYLSSHIVIYITENVRIAKFINLQEKPLSMDKATSKQEPNNLLKKYAQALTEKCAAIHFLLVIRIPLFHALTILE